MGWKEDYERLRKEHSLVIPPEFSFPLDVFDKWGDGLCLFWTDGSTERKFTFSGMKTLSAKGAGYLRAKGINPGDWVFVMLPAVPEWWEAMLAVMRLGAVPVPATTLLTSKDIEYRLRAANIKAVITDEENAGKIIEAAKNADKSPLLVTVDEYIKGRQSAPEFIGTRVPSNSPGIVYFTSGTTGPPKMVLHTQASYPLGHYITGRYWLDLTHRDLHWNLSDTGWAKAAWSSLFGPWHMGAAVFSFYKKGKFDPLHTLDVLSRYPITTFCGPPTAYRMMLKESSAKIDSKTLRHFVAAGEPLNKEIIERWAENTGHYIYDGYGQTETVNVLANLKLLPRRPGSMGLPVPGFDVDVIDEQAMPVSPGVEGDIAIRVEPQRPVGLFKEYFGNSKATGETIKGQWYITGDRAVRDGEGFFWFVGRADDVILTSGYRIGPFEIESVLIEHPAVRESAVVSSPDEIRGEIVKAFIVLTKEYAPSESLANELQNFVKARTAPYKYPRRVEFVLDLPKTISGKIKRKELKLKEWASKLYL